MSSVNITKDSNIGRIPVATLAAALVVVLAQAVAPPSSWAGACCTDDVCEDLAQAACEAQGGEYHGDPTTCAGIFCDAGEPYWRVEDPTNPPAYGAFLYHICLSPYVDPAEPTGSLVFFKLHDDSANPDPGFEMSVVKSDTTWAIHWAGADCTQSAGGACCLPTGGCQDVASRQACTDLGGSFAGNGTDCATTNCSMGACCLPDSSCQDVADEAACTALSGDWQGAGTDCATTNCAAGGACCLPDSSCEDVADQAACTALSGVWQGVGTDCATTNCGPTNGACCLPTGGCQDVADEPACTALSGMYMGAGTDCATTTCPTEPGACCFVDGNCQDLTLDGCIGAGGFFQGETTECATTVCPVGGACCLPDGDCIDVSSVTDCSAQGGIFRGTATECATLDPPCQPFTGACCLPDASCLDDETQQNCQQGLGGEFMGIGVTCDSIECVPAEAGACCLPDSSCRDNLLETECVAGAQGTFMGAGTSCDQVECGGLGACCLDIGVCQGLTRSACEGQGGDFKGLPSNCNDNGSGVPWACAGACCLPDFSCEDVPGRAQCLALSGEWKGDGTDCNSVECLPPAVCGCCLDPWPTCQDLTEAECVQQSGLWFGSPCTRCASLDCPR